MGSEQYGKWDTMCSYWPYGHSLFTFILPYIEDSTIFNATNLNFVANADSTQNGVYPGPAQVTALQCRSPPTSARQNRRR